jgi:hypothetical protein
MSSSFVSLLQVQHGVIAETTPSYLALQPADSISDIAYVQNPTSTNCFNLIGDDNFCGSYTMQFVTQYAQTMRFEGETYVMMFVYLPC